MAAPKLHFEEKPQVITEKQWRLLNQTVTGLSDIMAQRYEESQEIKRRLDALNLEDILRKIEKLERYH